MHNVSLKTSVIETLNKVYSKRHNKVSTFNLSIRYAPPTRIFSCPHYARGGSWPHKIYVVVASHGSYLERGVIRCTRGALFFYDS